MKTTQITAGNRAAWDASAPYHRTGPYWDALCSGFQDPAYSRFDDIMTDALRGAGIKGARALQVGCNNGRETLSACALGAAEAWGLDQSAAFLEQAAHLRDLSGHPATFVQGDIYDVPETLPRDFDIIFITIGVLNWMPDLPRFFTILHGMMAPGARLVIYETHPALEMFDPASDHPNEHTISYFRKAPFVETQAITYDGSDQGEIPESYWFVHGLGTIIQALLDCGLRLSRLEEFPHNIRETDYDIYSGQAAQIPMSFLAVASNA